jgi:hypothetical protein
MLWLLLQTVSATLDGGDALSEQQHLLQTAQLHPRVVPRHGAQDLAQHLCVPARILPLLEKICDLQQI